MLPGRLSASVPTNAGSRAFDRSHGARLGAWTVSRAADADTLRLRPPNRTRGATRTCASGSEPRLRIRSDGSRGQVTATVRLLTIDVPSTHHTAIQIGPQVEGAVVAIRQIS